MFFLGGDFRFCAANRGDLTAEGSDRRPDPAGLVSGGWVSLRLAVLLLAAACLLGLLPAHSGAQTLPQLNTRVHLGAQSCGGSVCHGATQAWPTSSVTQNESIIWSKHDRHSRAFRTLTTDASKRIARNFGIDDATTSQVCLGCHADNVAPDAQGPLFDIADGVGCEVCHGGAIDWIGAHVDNLRSHENNLRLGLYPTVDPLARARLCASCHVQSAQLFVSHRLYGAGHPRLRFELDTFLVLQPMHARMDEDYILRKRPASNAKFWAVGQIVTAQALLGVMADPALTVDGRFPELALFDCQSCHHRTKDADDAAWRSSQKVLPRLDLSALILAAGIAEALAPDLAPDLIAGVETLRASGERSMTDVNRGAAQLARPISALLLRVQSYPFRPRSEMPCCAYCCDADGTANIETSPMPSRRLWRWHPWS